MANYYNAVNAGAKSLLTPALVGATAGANSTTPQSTASVGATAGVNAISSNNNGGNGGNGTGKVTTSTPTTNSVNSNLGDSYSSMINGMLAQQRAAAQEAYNNSMSRLGSAWDDTINALASNRQSTLSQLKNNYDYSSGQATDDANKSLREAYVNYMLNKRNMNQNLSAMGVSGGASESTMANMYNAYGNSRNNINTTLADNLASLLNTYQNNVNSAEQLYNTQYADARNNYMSQMNALESALANNLVSSYSGGSLSNLANYASKLGSLVQNMADATWTPTENTLAQSNVSIDQGAGQSGDVTNYAKYKAMSDELAKNGATASQIITQLQKNGASANDIFSVFNV